MAGSLNSQQKKSETAPFPQHKIAKASCCYYRLYEIRKNKRSHNIRAMRHENTPISSNVIRERYAYVRTLGQANIAQPAFLIGC